MANLFSLEGKNAWVTGACYGIGFAIAKAFAQAGASNIIFNARSQEAIDKALADYRAAGIHNAYGYVCDVTDESAVKALVDRIHAEVGQIDILVNNAGIIKRIPSCAQVQTRSDRLICTIFVNERLTPVGRFFSFVW